MSSPVWMPTRYTPPLSDDFPTDGDALAAFAELAWTTPESTAPFRLHDWQRWLLRHVLERYPDDWPDESLAGRLRFRQAVISVGRQNGKSVLGALLALYSLLWAEGANVVGVASSVDQANIIFRRVLLVVHQNPALQAVLGRANETRGITSKDGRRSYQVKPAKESALQGIPATAVIYDELHLVKPEQWAAMVLGTSATGGSVYGITTAGDQDSELLKNLYTVGAESVAAAEGHERFGFWVWEAPPGAAVDDAEAIKAANPTVAEGHIAIDQVLDDIKSIPPADAQRYRLNRFVESRDDVWIEADALQRVLTSSPMPNGRIVLGVDRSHGWEYATVTAATKTDSHIYSEIVATLVKPTKDSLLALLLDLAKLSPVAIYLESWMLKELAADLRATGLTVYALNPSEIANASSTIYALIKQRRVKIHADPLLMMQSPHAVKKYRGDHWRIAKADNKREIDAVMATAVAVYGASRDHDIGPQLHV